MRPRKDKFEETSIGFRKGTEHELVYVSSPSFSKVTFKTKISEYLDGKPVYGTSDQIIRSLHTSTDIIKKLFREKNAEVIKIEKSTISMSNICEKCHERGIPRIEKKSNKIDYHARAGRGHRFETNRLDEYWLIYDHKTKKCRIAQYDINHNLFKTSKNRIKKLYKHFFPFYLEWLKRELVA